MEPIRVFDDFQRTDARPATHSESRFQFLNRSASVYFSRVRDLIDATMVDNVSGIRRVLAAKVSRYGDLDAPLILAVQSNTMFPTDDYEVERVLYGASVHRPSASAQRRDHLIEEGFWIDAAGWKNSHVPQVVSVAGLAPRTVQTTVPRLWNTLDENVELPTQPALLAPVDVLGAEAQAGISASPHVRFGLGAGWPGLKRPDFDTT